MLAARAALTVEAVARGFKGARTNAVAEIAETLAVTGAARRLEDGRYAV